MAAASPMAEGGDGSGAVSKPRVRTGKHRDASRSARWSLAVAVWDSKSRWGAFRHRTPARGTMIGGHGALGASNSDSRNFGLAGNKLREGTVKRDSLSTETTSSASGFNARLRLSGAGTAAA